MAEFATQSDSVASDARANKARFLALLMRSGALRFGQFTLKSGRISPYFFNLGLISDGESLRELSLCYAKALQQSGWQFDTLFGPAYKGIALSACTSVALSGIADNTVGFAYNRKEAKKHGEGGNLVGEVKGRRVVIVDDILTAGTAAREAADLLLEAGAQIQGLIVALDRQEQGPDGRSATAALSAEYGFPVASVAGFDDVIAYVREQEPKDDRLEALEAYRATYGA